MDFSVLIKTVGLGAKKYLPEILTGVGVGGSIAAMVVLTTKSKQIEAIKEAYREDMKLLETTNEEAEMQKQESGKREIYDPDAGVMIPYPIEEHKKCKRIVLFNAIKHGAKELWLPATIELVSVGLIFAGSGISRHRANESAIAFSALAGAYAAYRERVQKAIGEEAECKIRYGIEEKEIVEEFTDDKGKTKTKKTVVNEISDPIANPFAVYFDASCKGFVKNAEYNKNHLINIQSALTDKLKKQGFLFVNDIYYAVGVSQTQAGHDWGWLYDPNNKFGVDHIDLGIFNACNMRACNFDENVFLLDITPQANITERLWTVKDYTSKGSSNFYRDMIDYPQMYLNAVEDGTI